MKRRDFLHAGALGFPLAPQALAQNAPRFTGKPALKITDIQSFLVGIESRNLCFVKILTDQGITGWGEAYSVGPDEATVATIRDFKSWLLGKDPRNVEYLWATMYNFTRFPAVRSSMRPSAVSSMRYGTSPARPRDFRCTC